MNKNNRKIRSAPIMPLLALVLFTASAPFGIARDEEMGISQALRTALKDNPASAAAAWGETAARHRVAEARGTLLPQITASAGYTRFQEPMTVFPIHQPGSFPPLDRQIYDAGIQVALPLTAGRLLAGVDLAKAARTEAGAALDALRLETLLRTAGFYIAGLELTDRTNLLDAHIKALEERTRELSTLEEEGMAALADLALAQTSLASARADEADLLQAGREISAALGAHLGRKEPVQPKPPSLRREALNQGPESGIEMGPKAQLARARLEGAESGEKAARWALWPDLRVFAGNVWRAGGDRDFTGEWSAGLSLQIPLGDYARRAAQIRAAQAGAGAARDHYREAMITQASATRTLESRMEALALREEHLAQAEAAREVSVAAYRERFAEGRLPLSELLAGEAELLQLRIRRQGAIYQRVSAFFEYHSLRGSLSEDLILSVLED